MSKKYILIVLLICFAMQCYPQILRAQEQTAPDPSQISVRFDMKKGTVYQMINRVSDLTGYYFIYDSELVDNEKKVRVVPGDYHLRDLVRKITGNGNIELRIQGSYLLIYLPYVKSNTEPVAEPVIQVDSMLVIRGKLLDRITGEPVIYGTVNVEGSSMAALSNRNGEFMLKIPDSLSTALIRISHMGYLNRLIDASLIAGRNIDIFLDQKVIPLQEIVVRIIDPKAALREMLRRREENNQLSPVHMTTFFREGVDNKSGFNLTEAVLRIYKTGIQASLSSEQVKILKMRRLTSPGYNDTLVTRLKSSINSCQMLDLIKNLPDFLDLQYNHYYDFTHTDITVLDNRRVWVFSFVQKEEVTDPLFTGKLYVDAENYALLKATFEINPSYVHKSAETLVLRQSRHIRATPLSARYEVSYAPYSGKYYLSHVRADLELRMKKRGKIFGSNVHVWFEMANCETDTVNVKRFSAEERVSTRDFFAEHSYVYDEKFWGQFNTLIPEKSLVELIRKYDFSFDR